MGRRAQATIELLALLGVAAGLAGFVVLAAGADGASFASRLAAAIPGHQAVRQDDRWALRSPTYGPLVRRYVPVLVLERDRWGEDRAVPIDPAVCRRPWCAALGTGRPAIFTHVVRRPGVTFLEYWFYYPDSQTTHIPVTELKGFHHDDWEGLIVRVGDAGDVTARVTAHSGLTGASAWWSADPGWQVIGPHPVVYRASGSHANGFGPTGIDVFLDRWNGELGRVASFDLIAGDTAASLRFRYDPGVVPPWRKALWSNPEATSTGGAPSRSGPAPARRAGHQTGTNASVRRFD